MHGLIDVSPSARTRGQVTPYKYLELTSLKKYLELTWYLIWNVCDEKGYMWLDDVLYLIWYGSSRTFNRSNHRFHSVWQWLYIHTTIELKKRKWKIPNIQILSMAIRTFFMANLDYAVAAGASCGGKRLLCRAMCAVGPLTDGDGGVLRRCWRTPGHSP
jgi:hypothetical protein